jgi:hypothetical protein
MGLLSLEEPASAVEDGGQSGDEREVAPEDAAAATGPLTGASKQAAAPPALTSLDPGSGSDEEEGGGGEAERALEAQRLLQHRARGQAANCYCRMIAACHRAKWAQQLPGSACNRRPACAAPSANPAARPPPPPSRSLPPLPPLTCAPSPCRLLDEAWQVYEWMVEDGLRPDRATYSRLISMCAAALGRHAATAETLYERMKEEGVEADAYVYLHLVSALGAGGEGAG